MDTAGDLSIHLPRERPWAYNGDYLCAADILGAYRIAIIAGTSPPVVTFGLHRLAVGASGRAKIRNALGCSFGGEDHQWTYNSPTSVTLQDFAGDNRTLTGAHTRNSGIIYLCRLMAFGYVSGTSLSLSTGDWCVGDRFLNLAQAGTDAAEWICTTSGEGALAVWTAVGSGGGGGGGGGLTFRQALAISSLRL